MSAYQREGAAAAGGREPSVWADWLRRTVPAAHRHTSDFYHHYEEDIAACAAKDYLIALVGAAMEKYDIPMSSHLDHHEDVADIEDTVAAGCRSVMIDASKLPYEENVKKFAHAVKAFFKEHPEANDPRKYMTPGKQAMKEVVIHKIKVCGSEGRA